MKDQILAALQVETLSARQIRRSFGQDGIDAADALVDERKVRASFDGFGTEYSLKPLPDCSGIDD